MQDLLKLIKQLYNTNQAVLLIAMATLLLIVGYSIYRIVVRRRQRNTVVKEKLTELEKKTIEDERIERERSDSERYRRERITAAVMAMEMEILDAERREKERLEAECQEREYAEAERIKQARSKGKVIKIEPSDVTRVSKAKANADRTANVGDEKEPTPHKKVKDTIIESSTPVIDIKKHAEPTDELPESKEEGNKQLSGILFVNYESSIPEQTDHYPMFRMPKYGSIVRTHRFGNTKRRGYKEESFQEAIQNYFGACYLVSGEVRLNTGKETRPFEPDIAIIDTESGKNIRIDIEIDEPYAGITRQPTHCKGEDFMRDTYFVDRGWIVIRFSEYQVHTEEFRCLSYIASIIKSIDSSFSIPAELSSVVVKIENLWDVVQAQKWEKERYREKYLKHEFGEIPDETETIERDFNDQEINEENLVQPTEIGQIEDREHIGFNKANAHARDIRIKFYPEPHVYTIDNAPAPSASTIVSKFFPKFDSVYWSNYKSLELGMSPEAVAKMWKDKGQKDANEGTYLHEQIEKYYLNQEFQRTGEFHLFEQFAKDHSHFVPYRSEWRIFDEDFHIAGTIDLITKTTNGFELYDWKRSGKVINPFDGKPIDVDTYGNFGIGELSHIYNTSYNQYCLQQSLYRYILEKKYDMTISNMYLVVIHPDYVTYYKVEVPYQKDEVEYILKTL